MPDELDLQGGPFVASSPLYTPFDVATSASFTLVSPPTAGSTVTIMVVAAGDFGEPLVVNEYIDVLVNGTFVGLLEWPESVDCDDQVSGVVTLSASAYNALVAGGNAVITLVAGPSVNVGQCPGSYAQLGRLRRQPWRQP